jgi:response regulator RpfG family c-di-GMP phosphodiesterase
MTLVGTVLLVDDEPLALHAHGEILRLHGGLRVLTASDGDEGLAIARIHRPDLVVSDLRMPGLDGAELCRAIRADRTLEGCMFVLLTGVQEPSAEIADHVGIDDILLKPVTAVELVAKVRSMLRLKRLHDQLRADKQELERLHRAEARRIDQLLELLVHLVDLRVPGAATRGAECARLAAELAERFDVPASLRRDLDIAARLLEIGRVVLEAEPGDGEGPEDVIEGDGWRYAVAARDLLSQTEGLTGAADLVGGTYENWDGTGHPERLRQGQIPLRSRILRAIADLQDLVSRGGGLDPIAAVEALQLHAGTRYDPLVVAYLDATVRASGDRPAGEPRVRVAVGRLRGGMVLADDLCTSSGIKLLAGGAILSEASLETIRRRHRSDPIVHGVWIRRDAEA